MPSHDVPAKSVVWRLQWKSRHSAQLLAPNLLRDSYIATPIPLPSTSLSFTLLDSVPIHLHLVSVHPHPLPSHSRLVGSPQTHHFLLPPIAPNLQPHSLLPIPPQAFSSAAHLPALLRLSLCRNPVLKATALPPPSSILLYGSPGVGKTSVVAHITHLASAVLIPLSSSYLHTHALSPSALRQTLLHFVHAAEACAPAVILLDDAHFIFPPDDHSATAALLHILDIVHHTRAPIALILTAAPHLHALHPAIPSAVRACLPLTLSIAPPFGLSLAMRHSRLPRDRLAAQLPSARVSSPAALVTWARALDSSCIISSASMPSSSLSSSPVSPSSSSPSSSPSAESPTVSTPSLPGLAGVLAARRALQRTLSWPRLRAATMKQLSLTRARGLLLYGPPGTGKTAVVRAAAETAGYVLHAMDAATLARGQVGASERLLSSTFSQAKASAPTVLFFDEADALFAIGKTPHRMRLASKMAMLMDELDDDVVVVAATNRPWAIAPILLRAGRLETRVLVALPTAEERADIARVLTDGVWDAETRDAFVRLAGSEKATGFSGADLAGISRRAGLAAAAKNEEVTERYVEAAFSSTVPSVSPEEAARIAAWS